MRHYETIYIVNPNLSDDEYGAVFKKFSDLLEKHKGVIIRTEEWGKQKLAYDVRKFDRGSYVLVNYCGESVITGEVERELKLDERILLFQTIKLSDKANPDELLKEEKGTKRPKSEDQAQDLKTKNSDQIEKEKQSDEVRDAV